MLKKIIIIIIIMIIIIIIIITAIYIHTIYNLSTHEYKRL